MSVITRFAPSPTGLLHAGNYRTAVFAYLVARQNNGSFILRIEDTDRARSKQEYEDNIYEALAWLGLDADKTRRQSANAARHRAVVERLVEDGQAYVSHETPKDPGGRTQVIRFRNPGGTVSFTDTVRGEIAIDVGDLGDFVIARSFDEPLFHLAVVVDDADDGVTTVIRGEDHISNTPRHILLQHALGFPTPTYAHVPLVLGSDRTKLSKRRGARALTEYRDQGFLPEAMLNYLAFLGWHPSDNNEYLSLHELIKQFDLSRLQKGGAIFDETKLRSINQHWMRELSDTEFISHLGHISVDTITQQERVRKAVPLLKERAQTFGEAREIFTNELAYLFEAPTLDRAILAKKEPADRPALTKVALTSLLDVLATLPSNASAETIKGLLMPLADAEEKKCKGGRGAVLWPLRYALSGQERSPDPFTIVSIIGRDESLARVRAALALLEP